MLDTVNSYLSKETNSTMKKFNNSYGDSYQQEEIKKGRKRHVESKKWIKQERKGETD